MEKSKLTFATDLVKANEGRGVILYGQGVGCLCCCKTFPVDLREGGQWLHPDLSQGPVPILCGNNGKIYQIPVLKEVV